MYRGRLLIVVLVLPALLAACATVPGRSSLEIGVPETIGQSSSPIHETISVTGLGQATGAPDLATVTLAVEARAPNIAEAMQTSNRTVEAVMQALLAQGIDQADMQSTGFNVWREDVYNPETGRPTDQPIYHVDSSLTVSIHGVERASEIVEIGLNAGATNVWGLSFSIDDRAALESEARSLAWDDAADRAAQIAEAMGVSLGQAVIASELAGGGVLGIDQFGVAREMGGGAGPPFSGGLLDVSIQLDVVYTIER